MWYHFVALGSVVLYCQVLRLHNHVHNFSLNQAILKEFLKRILQIKSVCNVLMTKKVNILMMLFCVLNSTKRRDCYMICVGDFMDMLTSPEGRRLSSGLVIGCTVDTSSGELTYYINGREIGVRYQVRS